MSDRLFFPLLGLITAGMVALALVWPQGLGTRSPGPFGHPPTAPVANPPGPPSAPSPDTR